MFAKRWQQNKEISLKFQKKINTKQKAEKAKVTETFRKKTFGLSWFIEGGINNSLNEVNLRKQISGNAGEYVVDQALWFWLPHAYNLFHSVILNPVGDMFIQMDHLALSQKGIFIIETKNWKGFVEGNNESWRKTTQYSGLEIMKNNPYKEQLLHLKMFKLWGKYNFSKYYERIEKSTYPLIIFEGCTGLNVNCSIPVFRGIQGALGYILEKAKADIFTKEEVFEICHQIQIAH